MKNCENWASHSNNICRAYAAYYIANVPKQTYFKANFDNVVASWSLRTQEAWINNMKFTEHDVKEVRRIRLEITQSLIDQLLKIHGTISAPKTLQIDEIIHDIFQVWIFKGKLNNIEKFFHIKTVIA